MFDDYDRLPRGEQIRRSLDARKIEFILTAVITVVFAVCFAYLEYFYIKEREAQPVIGNMYMYHIFPMFFIFALVSFATLLDSMTFKLFRHHYDRAKAAMVGSGNLIVALTMEDFGWFANRALAPIENDPRGGLLMQASDWTSIHMGAIDAGSFVVPVWYLVAAAFAALSYYGGFRNHNRTG